MSAPQVSARIGALIARAAGVHAGALAASTGFDPARIVDPDAMIPLAQEEALWEQAAVMIGDDCFGLHAAETLQAGQAGVLDYAIRTAANVRASLTHLIRYNRLLHDLASFSMFDTPEGVRIEHRFTGTDLRPCRQASEFTLASLVVIGAQITGKPVIPLRIEFAHPAPASTLEHERVFGIAPRFAMPVSAITLSNDVLNRPVLGADPELARIVTGHAENLLRMRPQAEASIVVQVSGLLTRSLADGPVSLADVARRMHMSERSLQRRLSEAGTTFAAIVDEVRKELALRYLADRRLALGEIAYLLGFAEPSPFHRAFKRWTGTTPALMRQSMA